MTPTAAKRESFRRLDETCPLLDSIMADMASAISNNFRFDDCDDVILQEEVEAAVLRIRKEVSEPLRQLSIDAFCLVEV